ncbi:MAG TPA: hypothetical protein VMH83_04665, partial [Candidatus Acidoferrum sp.]|nr:hypothetical protein [Candidatus Acidoferrum sp.]
NELHLHASELEPALNYALQTQYRGNARVGIVDGVATIEFSLPVQAAPFGSWLNGKLQVITRDRSRFEVDALWLGDLRLPAALGNTLLPQFEAGVRQRSARYSQMVAAIRTVTLDADEFVIAYEWRPELMAKLAARGRELVLEPGQQQRLAAYAVELARVTRDAGPPGKLSVTRVLAPLLHFAAQRGGSAVEENRAALQLLALYAINLDPRRLLGDLDGLGTLVRHDLRLGGRRDSAQHYLISAALAASAGSAFASEIGVLKEEDDTTIAGGSGFSFTDLAIDQAGTRLGQLAVADEMTATRVQQLLGASDLQENLFAPAINDLPELLSKTEFAKRYQSVGSPAYELMNRSIAERIERLPLIQQLRPAQ